MSEIKTFIEICRSGTEEELREVKVPFIEAHGDLSDVISALAERKHDYGTCVYAMSIASTATFNYIAHTLGVTGFQSSCADLDIIRRTRHLEGPFMLVKAEDDLYPQSAPMEKVVEFIRSPSTLRWLKEQAAKKLEEHGPDFEHIHPNVLTHWKLLAGAEIPDDGD